MCGPRARERAARVEDADRLEPSHSFALAHPLDDISRLAAAQAVPDAIVEMQLQRGGSFEVVMGGQPSHVVKAVAGRRRPRWWRGAGSFAMTTTSGDRYGWSGVESSRNRAPTDSQHFSQQHSQQCSQTRSRHAVEGSARSGNSQQHSQDYSQQHSQALVTAL